MLSNAHLTRQLDIIPMDRLKATKVHVIGCGAIGSFLALQIAKMGLTDITVYDHDEVSIENMSNQFFRFSDIGKPKAHALQALIKDFTGVDITIHARKWTKDDKLEGIVIAAVDSMTVRKEIFEAAKLMFGVNRIIDPRMSAEDAALYVMSPHLEVDVKAYDATMYSDSEAVQERCTAKSTIYTANLLSGLSAKAVKNLVCGEPYPRVTTWSIKNNAQIAFTSKS